MKKVKSLHIATLILSFLAEVYGVYSLLNGGDSIEAICWLSEELYWVITIGKSF